MPPVSPLTSPLHDRHVAAGAKLADFGGWAMPIEYAGGGVLAEHAAVREAVGLFDVSHLGTATVRGPGAAAFVDSCLTNDLSPDRPRPGAVHAVLRRRSGGVVDDLIVYLHGPDDVLLVPNAANAAEVLRRLAGRRPGRGRRSPTSTRRSPSSPCRGRARCRCWSCSGCRASWPTCRS